MAIVEQEHASDAEAIEALHQLVSDIAKYITSMVVFDVSRPVIFTVLGDQWILLCKRRRDNSPIPSRAPFRPRGLDATALGLGIGEFVAPSASDGGGL
jgi:hypothetical protein